MRGLLVGILSFVMLLAGCSRSVDSRLARVSQLADCNATDSALAVLGNVCRDSLNEHNRYYYDLMNIKARDKAYLDITTDTTITDIIAYFERRGSENELGEAYYYGGRVSREQGDAPQALDYFQKSLDALQSPEHMYRKGKIASQMGQIFLELYMFEQAKPKFQEAIAYQTACGDSVGLILNLRAFGDVYSEMNKSDSALFCYSEALNLIQGNNCNREIGIRSSIINHYISQGEYEKAKKEFIIFDTLSQRVDKDHVLSTKINIHIINRDYVKAIELSRKLKHSQSLTSKIFAYSILLDYSKEIENNDSIYYYAIAHKQCIDSLNLQMSANAVIHQNSFYNYVQKEKENHNLKEQRNRIITNSLIVILLLIVVVCISIFAYRIIRKKNIKLNNSNKRLHSENEILKLEITELLTSQEKMHIELLQQLDKITLLEKNNESLKKNITDKEISEEIKKRVQERIRNIDIENYDVDYKITTSNVYIKLRNELSRENGVTDESIWAELDCVVNDVYPNFKSQLFYLYSRLNNLDYRVCLLLKCKFTPKEIAILVFRDKSTISNIRVRLNNKFFGVKGCPSDFDKFILSL